MGLRIRHYEQGLRAERGRGSEGSIQAELGAVEKGG
jgi:hypothetical protein